MRRLGACLLILAFVSCSNAMTKKQAAALIRVHPDFTEKAAAKIRVGGSLRSIFDKGAEAPLYVALQKLEYATIDHNDFCWLTDKGKEAAKKWEAISFMGQQWYNIAYAERELVEVLEIEMFHEGKVARAKYTWRWKPINEIGETLDASALDTTTKNVAYAVFDRREKGWEVRSVR